MPVNDPNAFVRYSTPPGGQNAQASNITVTINTTEAGGGNYSLFLSLDNGVLVPFTGVNGSLLTATFSLPATNGTTWRIVGAPTGAVRITSITASTLTTVPLTTTPVPTTAAYGAPTTAVVVHRIVDAMGDAQSPNTTVVLGTPGGVFRNRTFGSDVTLTTTASGVPAVRLRPNGTAVTYSAGSVPPTVALYSYTITIETTNATGLYLRVDNGALYVPINGTPPLFTVTFSRPASEAVSWSIVGPNATLPVLITGLAIEYVIPPRQTYALTTSLDRFGVIQGPSSVMQIASSVTLLTPFTFRKLGADASVDGVSLRMRVNGSATEWWGNATPGHYTITIDISGGQRRLLQTGGGGSGYFLLVNNDTITVPFTGTPPTLVAIFDLGSVSTVNWRIVGPTNGTIRVVGTTVIFTVDGVQPPAPSLQIPQTTPKKEKDWWKSTTAIVLFSVLGGIVFVAIVVAVVVNTTSTSTPLAQSSLKSKRAMGLFSSKLSASPNSYQPLGPDSRSQTPTKAATTGIHLTWRQ